MLIFEPILKISVQLSIIQKAQSLAKGTVILFDESDMKEDTLLCKGSVKLPRGIPVVRHMTYNKIHLTVCQAGVGEQALNGLSCLSCKTWVCHNCKSFKTGQTTKNKAGF